MSESWAAGPTIERVSVETCGPVRAGYVDEHGREVPLDRVRALRTPAYPV